MHIDAEKVEAVLLADGWHTVAPFAGMEDGTFYVRWGPFFGVHIPLVDGSRRWEDLPENDVGGPDLPPVVPWFSFDEPGGPIVTGPLSSIIALRVRDLL